MLAKATKALRLVETCSQEHEVQIPISACWAHLSRGSIALLARLAVSCNPFSEDIAGRVFLMSLIHMLTFVDNFLFIF